ncbi:BON domain-containing protein [Pigmentiphaga sp. H8]|nr:BON domain-containing protein [Pigmentiphaga sp. H8]
MIAAMIAAFSAATPLAMAQSDGQSTKESASSFAGDTVITTKVKAALLKEQATQSLSIKVKTVKGVVQLSGSADDSAQIDSAVRVARGIDGVQDVRNDIQLKKTGDR